MINLMGITQQVPPTASTDNTQQQIRLNRRGDLMVMRIPGAGMSSVAAEGAYFRALNPTIGTGVAMGNIIGWVATTPLFLIRNMSPDVTNGPNIYMDYIRLIVTTAGAGATSSHGAIIIDSVNRYASAGTAVTNIYNAWSGSQGPSAQVKSIANIYYIPTASAASYPKQIGRFVVKTQATPCWSLGDQVVINFGSDAGNMGAIGGSSSNATQITISIGPAVIESGFHSLLFYLWNPASSTATQFEWEIGWWEK